MRNVKILKYSTQVSTKTVVQGKHLKIISKIITVKF